MKLVFMFLVLLITCGFTKPDYCLKDVINGKISKVVDGDTVKVIESDGTEVKIRFLGIDTPETNYYGENQGSLAYEASKRMLELLPLDIEVKVVSDLEKCDSFGRYLGYIIRKKDNLNINFEMLKEGYAVPYQIYPNFNKDIYPASKIAYDQDLKIYNGEVMVPYEWRRQISDRPFTYYTVDIINECYVKPEDYESVEVINRYFFNKLKDIPSKYKQLCD